ncbi:exosortase [Siccirubricoccus sp. KC 17139]|uniref:Exosortase n=1 Tax=Siccirubricoccus soli TaxID=2899147 RepID=A0ABT1DEY1_9PROT|nr:exosortase A [Siccirubricoccus soli]MCO6419785.1 exosortase [Siccirubricoccus soli]MCP2685920.1 exosortase [Siccirubricoccus soli]
MSQPLAASMPAPAPAASAAEWRGPLLWLAGAVLTLALVFLPEGMAAVRVWNASTAYNHCWLVLPIALWLAWQRRFRLAGLRPAPEARFALLALPPALAWLAAERLGLMEGRQFAALGLLEVAVLAILGWRVFRAFAAPLLYLVFLIPFGAFAVPALQQVTVRLIEVFLSLTDIPFYIDDLLIQIPEGDFLVAEACAGLRFLVAALAFGALYAATMFRSPGRRLTVMLLALGVPILANGLRAFGIVWLGHRLGSAEAAAADHLIYGWLFFSAVILLLILAGLPFREDAAGPAPLPPAPPGPAAPPAAATAAGALLLVLALAAPTLAYALQRGGRVAEQALPLAPLPGCAVAEGGLALECDGARLTARLLAFPAGATWSAPAGARFAGFATTDDDVTFGLSQPGLARWSARQSRGGEGVVASGIWVAGQPSGGGLAARLDQAQRSLGLRPGRPVLALLRLQPAPGGEPGSAAERTLMLRLLEAQGEAIARAAAAASETAR